MSTTKDRERLDNLADLHSIITATEHIERAYIRDALLHDQYTLAINKLVQQFKTASWNIDVAKIMAASLLANPQARKRLVDTNDTATAKNVAAIVAQFITLMDSLKLNFTATDEIHPQLSDLVQSLGKSNVVLEGTFKIKQWMVLLNGLGASDELDQAQVRQLLFDLDTAHQEFQNTL